MAGPKPLAVGERITIDGVEYEKAPPWDGRLRHWPHKLPVIISEFTREDLMPKAKAVKKNKDENWPPEPLPNTCAGGALRHSLTNYRVQMQRTSCLLQYCSACEMFRLWNRDTRQLLAEGNLLQGTRGSTDQAELDRLLAENQRLLSERQRPPE